MDGADLILTNPVTPTTVLIEQRAKTEKTEQLAKDFETVLLTKLVDEMKETVGNWGLEEEDAASGQVQGLFWMYLAQDLGDKGGLGLWKDLHRFFTDMQSPAEPPASQSVDEVL
jgi:Rod binding domain-containing protein